MVWKWSCVALIAMQSVVVLSATAAEENEVTERKAAVAPLRLSLKRACELAQQSGPLVLGARAREAEAEGGRVEAQVFPRQNPVLEVIGGPKIFESDVSPSISVSLKQTVDLGGGVTAREAKVDAEVESARAHADLTALEISRDVAVAFVRALWARERLAISTEIHSIAQETLRTASLRLQGGDVSKLELNVARVAVSRAASSMRSMEAERSAALGDLRLLLGLSQDQPIELEGALADGMEVDLADLLGRGGDRPDLKGLAAELRAAKAEGDLADALAAPQLGLGVQYEHEDEANTIMGVLSITLPMFDHAQGLTARAEATSRRVEAERIQLSARIPIQIRAAYEVYEHRLAAAKELEADGAGAYAENLHLAKRGFEAGETTLPELLLLRREILEGKLDHLDRQLETREAAVLLLVSAGVSP